MQYKWVVQFFEPGGIIDIPPKAVAVRTQLHSVDSLEVSWLEPIDKHL